MTTPKAPGMSHVAEVPLMPPLCALPFISCALLHGVLQVPGMAPIAEGPLAPTPYALTLIL